MITQDIFLKSNFTVITWIRNFILTFLKGLNNYYYNIEENGKNNNYVNNTLYMEEINIKAEQVLQEYGDYILRVAYSYLHNMSDAEDVVQDTIIQYIKKNISFESSEHEKAWLIRVAINISKNRIIYNKKREVLEIDENLLAEEEEDLRFVWDAVKNLPQKYRQVIHLFYYEGYTTAQIAKILSKNEVTIRSLLHRGRKKLKEILKEVYDFDE